MIQHQNSTATAPPTRGLVRLFSRRRKASPSVTTDPHKQQTADSSKPGPAHEDATSDCCSTYCESSTRSIHSSLEESEKPCPISPLQRRSTVVRFHENANQIHIIPARGATHECCHPEELHYAPLDYIHFKQVYGQDVKRATPRFSTVLQSTYQACRQVTFETSRCILSRQEEEDFLNGLERQCDDQEWVGLENSLIHCSNSSNSKSRSDGQVRLVRLLRSTRSQEEARRLVETTSRADRLVARLVAQAHAVLLAEEEADQP
eukprot:CAMPEP_0172439608 /NCGR_PEP_ID=MMETSP1065-20121228/535_1 /TAXON_ID=265537 /ORGANISM="Amphiprora paludosa, Strain CCMP125" /LENGTH=261 /DNA_ID=CAMNT_0013188311 /DNA_START=96 /DNA_END=881 /DNA_ORIENTATION=+